MNRAKWNRGLWQRNKNSFRKPLNFIALSFNKKKLGVEIPTLLSKHLATKFEICYHKFWIKNFKLFKTFGDEFQLVAIRYFWRRKYKVLLATKIIFRRQKFRRQNRKFFVVWEGHVRIFSLWKLSWGNIFAFKIWLPGNVSIQNPPRMFHQQSFVKKMRAIQTQSCISFGFINVFLNELYCQSEHSPTVSDIYLQPKRLWVQSPTSTYLMY